MDVVTLSAQGFRRSVADADKSTVDDVVMAPLKETELLQDRIDNHGDLPRLLEEMAVDEQVVTGQEDTQDSDACDAIRQSVRRETAR